MWAMILMVVVAYAAAIVGGVLGCWYLFPWDPTTGYKELRDASAVFVGGLTIVTGTLTSLYSVQSNIKAAQALEQTKAALQEKLKLLEKQNSVYIETLKATALSRRIEAYKILLGSVMNCYDDLASMESGSWSEQSGIKFNEEMRAAARELMFLEPQDVILWRKIRARSHFLVESARCSTKPDEQIDLWKQNYVDFGKMVNEFETKAHDNVPSA
jgi:hypothetical protein